MRPLTAQFSYSVSTPAPSHSSRLTSHPRRACCHIDRRSRRSSLLIHPVSHQQSAGRIFSDAPGPLSVLHSAPRPVLRSQFPEPPLIPVRTSLFGAKLRLSGTPATSNSINHPPIFRARDCDRRPAFCAIARCAAVGGAWLSFPSDVAVLCSATAWGPSMLERFGCF
ncbi:hypothetical protein K466DRAFT_139721 [Polyporus arcularius HHB13444]|uniref:Uncharacterized protein n=1 Tax=Polyporus arcularius HHB13444 TaxID=1314778 RepID=A0A5C3PC04_9APHY|nr:hypothetical protein K466DRAFT_139721 [Polyporus arcularius HHB13444]